MTEVFGRSLADQADATGVVKSAHEVRYSSGLTRPDFFDWPGHLASILDQMQPDVVVVMFGANDAQGIETPSGPASFGSPPWLAEYSARVDALMTQLEGDGRIVYWIGQPVMRSGAFDARMQTLNGIYRTEAVTHPGIDFVDTRPLFTGPDGGYAAYLPGDSGRPVLMRQADGIHLTKAGGDRLAAAVLERLRVEWPF